VRFKKIRTHGARQERTTMGTRNQAMQTLLSALEQEVLLQDHGFRVEMGPTKGVVVERANHVWGIWHYYKKCFFWTAAGYTQPIFKTKDVDAALAYMLDQLTSQDIAFPTLGNASVSLAWQNRQNTKRYPVFH
jgi:hypothetical protein